MDGGLWANNPSLIALTEAMSKFKKPPDHIKVLSIGTGYAKNMYTKRRRWGLLTGWGRDKLISYTLGIQAQASRNMAKLILKERYLRMDPEIDTWELDDTKCLGNLKALADRDFTHNSKVILNQFKERRPLKHAEEFDNFIRSEVNLDRNRYVLLQERVRLVSEFLSRDSDSFEKRENQGSYALGTVIKPTEGRDYDSDVLIYMEGDRKKGPADYLQELYACLVKHPDYSGKLRQRTKSIEINYGDGFHMDVVPCVTWAEQDRVCNTKTGSFEPTGGTGYREWFKGKTEVTNGHLMAVTRLLKYMRNHKGSFDVPSVVLTSLIGHTVHYNERGKRFKDAPDTLRTVSNRMNSFLQATPRMPRFRNPALRSERFSKKDWNQSQYLNFQANFRDYSTRINDAFEETDAWTSIQKWRNLFGSGFGQS